MSSTNFREFKSIQICSLIQCVVCSNHSFTIFVYLISILEVVRLISELREQRKLAYEPDPMAQIPRKYVVVECNDEQSTVQLLQFLVSSKLSPSSTFSPKFLLISFFALFSKICSFNSKGATLLLISLFAILSRLQLCEMQKVGAVLVRLKSRLCIS